jgi:hypothetical protein
MIKKWFKVIGQQGEVNIREIASLPEGMETRPVERNQKGYILSHSERGHHHILTGGDVMERVNNVPSGMQIFYAILDKPEALIQDAIDSHEKFDLIGKFYEFRISREFNHFLQEARRVAD